MAGETSPNSTTGLDQFEIGEGISPGGNEELLDSLIDIADENSPRGPGLAPPHTVTSDAMELSAPVLDPGGRQHSLQDIGAPPVLDPGARQHSLHRRRTRLARAPFLLMRIVTSGATTYPRAPMLGPLEPSQPVRPSRARIRPVIRPSLITTARSSPIALN